MRLGLTQGLLAVAILLAASQINDATQPVGRFLRRRQSAEAEQESTTPRAAAAGQPQDNSQQADGQQSPRLYPDLPRQPNFLPPFNAPPGAGFQPAPPIPFGMQLPPANRLNVDQQPAPFGRLPPQPRQMTPAERLQSQSFAHGLGKRLLSMIGIESDRGPDQRAEASARNASEDPASRALQNATVLSQLNRGVLSIYGGLSRMYNSTVRDQLNLLQERFKAELGNNTNPWHQQVAAQVPAYFKQLAGKVDEAQEQLNRVWRDVSQANSSTLNRQQLPQQRPSLFGQFEQFWSEPNGNEGNFFSNRAQANGASPPNGQSQTNGTANQARDLAAKLRNMWRTQVEPELMLIRGEMARVWRDLLGSGGATRSALVGWDQQNTLASAAANASSSDLVDSILKEVDVSSPEYTLVGAKGDGDAPAEAAASTERAEQQQQQQQEASEAPKLSPQMQNRVVEMQKDLNRLWLGLSNSLQNALTNVKRTLNPRPQFEFLNPMESSSRQAQAAEPAQNEISGKIKDLAKVQRDADMVHEAVQQQQRETQQRQTIGDRFKGFFNNVDMQNINQLPDRIGEQFNRFGSAVGNFWNRLPERWDSFMTNARPAQSGQPLASGAGPKANANFAMVAPGEQ